MGEKTQEDGGTFNSVQRFSRVSNDSSNIPFDASDIVQVKRNNVLYEQQQRLINDYGIECYIIKGSAFSSNTYYITDKIEYDSDGTPTIYLTEEADVEQGIHEGRVDADIQGDHTGESGSRVRSATSDRFAVYAVQGENSYRTGEKSAHNDLQGISERNTVENSYKRGYLQGVQAEVKTIANDGHPIILVKEIANNEVQVDRRGRTSGESIRSVQGVSEGEKSDGGRVLRDGRGAEADEKVSRSEILNADELNGEIISNVDTQYQQRTETLLDREMLEFAGDKTVV